MKTNLIKSDAEYNRILENMRGVDFSGNRNSTDKRYSYLENMYRDYTAGGSNLVESVPGFRRIYSGTKINGLHLQTTQDGKRYLVINDNGVLYRFDAEDLSNPTEITGNAIIGIDAKSHSFNFKGKLYIGDTHNLKTVDAGGFLSQVVDNTANAPYVPTVYIDGKEYEQRNLLTAMFYEKHRIGSIGKFARETLTLLYRVTDEDAGLCSVCGVIDDPETVYIPSLTLIGEREYTVVSIDIAAFAGKKSLQTLYISDSVITVGASAFIGCSSLKSVVCGAGVAEIRDRAFSATALQDIYIPAAMKRFGENTIPATATVKYELDAIAYDLIEGTPQNTVSYGARVTTANLSIRLRSKTARIDAVTLNGSAVAFSTLRDSNNLITEVLIDGADKNSWVGGTLSILGCANTVFHQPDMDGKNFTERTSADYKHFTQPLRACSHSTVIGGRIFLWGTPDYPGVIFYSHRENAMIDGLYFGALDYIDLGADAEVLSVVGFSGGILVFSKGANDGECIRVYIPEKDSDISGATVFEVTESHRGSIPLGAGINHGSEVLFVSEEGLCAIGQRSLHLTGAIESRSTAIAAMLAKENLTEATLARWCGYLVLSVGGRMYLADTRTSADLGLGKEYEWFFLNGVGTYKNDSRVYRYATVARDGYLMSDTPDAIVDEEVWSEGGDSGEIIYFVNRGEDKIEVYPTEQFSGGDFYPADITLGFDDKLIFSTGCGDVCVFNNDMRGVAPERIATASDFDPEEYERTMGGRIHPDFYSFHNHAPRYALVCAYDDCGVPHLKKSTVKRSLTVKLATLSGGRVYCQVGCDGGGYRPVGSVDGVCDFSDLSFAAPPFDSGRSVTVALPERERSWVEKSIALYSEDFRSPFGVYSICYRYRISGRIKNI